MNIEQIPNIEELIQLPPDKKIRNHKVKRLTAPGENYGSLMLSVDLELTTPDGSEELKTVAKLVPPNEFMQEIFNTQVTFRNEIGYYKTIIPLLQNFQKEHGIEEVINFAAKYYGSRLNLENDDSAKVDENAALILENLAVEGYQSVNRLDGLDFEAARLVLENLAEFHAIPLAFRMQKPKLFEKEIKPFLCSANPKGPHEQMKKDQIRVLNLCPDLEPLRDRILTGFDRQLEERTYKGVFSTATHNDCWTNNNMFKFQDGKVVDSKLVDFQILNMSSPAKDIVFFIFSSVQNDVVTKRYNELLKIYFDKFLKTLADLKCNISRFKFEAFKEELDSEAYYSQFAHIVFMLLPIYSAKGTAVDIADMKPDSISDIQIGDAIINKYRFVCTEFAKRNWI